MRRRIFVLWQIDIFERVVINGWRLEYQNLFCNLETGACTWQQPENKRPIKQLLKFLIRA